MRIHCTPIGTIPADYPHMLLLCQKASITFVEEVVKRKDGTEESNTVWSIVEDDPSPSAPSTGSETAHSAGSGPSAGNNHLRFCMILDLIEYLGYRHLYRNDQKGVRIPKEKILSVAIGIETALVLPECPPLPVDLKKYESMDWRELYQHLSEFGIRGYEKKNTNSSAKLRAFGQKAISPSFGKTPLPTFD